MRSESSRAHYVQLRDETAVEQLLERFWALEELPQAPVTTKEEDECEAHFAATHQHVNGGRYMVRLPFKVPQQNIVLGNSSKTATNQLRRLEQRFERQPILAARYRDFMREYESLDHMRIATNDISNGYFIPHHGVVRESSRATKLRVVFNASAPLSNGKSLNDYLHIGSKLQDDLIDIVMRWRKHRIALTADIEKMFRQILIHPDDVTFPFSELFGVMRLKIFKLTSY